MADKEHNAEDEALEEGDEATASTAPPEDEDQVEEDAGSAVNGDADPCDDEENPEDEEDKGDTEGEESGDDPDSHSEQTRDSRPATRDPSEDEEDEEDKEGEDSGNEPQSQPEQTRDSRPATRDPSIEPGALKHPAEKGLPPLSRQEVPGREAGEPWTVTGIYREIRDEGPAEWVKLRWKKWAKNAAIALLIFAASYAVYGLYSWNRFDKPSVDTHFVYMAHMFNMCLDEKPPYDEECTLEMPVRPPHGNDWASYLEITVKGGEVLKGIWLNREEHKFKTLDGKMYILRPGDIDHRAPRTTRYFVSFPPGPALLMMPFIPDADSPEVDFRDPQKLGLNDVQFTIFFAALNVVLMFFVLQHLSRTGVSARTWKGNAVLTVLFALGTNVLWCSIIGQVWFTALVIGITFTLLYVWCAVDTRHPFLAGLFLALGMATRTPIAFSFVFFGFFLLFPNGKIRRSGWGEFLWKGVLFSVPILCMGFFLMWMNETRFGNPFEFGHTYLAQGQLYRIQRYGLFNYHFLAKNLQAAFTLLPRVQTYEPYFIFSKHGMSLFLTTPPLLYLIAYRSGARTIDRKWFWALWLTVAAVAIPGLFYQNTGWSQYGFRFSLDYTPYLVFLLALNRRRIGAIFIALMTVGILVNSMGAATFGRAGHMYADWMIDPDR